MSERIRTIVAVRLFLVSAAIAGVALAAMVPIGTTAATDKPALDGAWQYTITDTASGVSTPGLGTFDPTGAMTYVDSVASSLGPNEPVWITPGYGSWSA